MDFKLPEPRTKALAVNPQKLLILSVGKMGKTTILSKLEDCLILDLEGGSDYVDSGVIIDIRKETKRANKERKEDENPISELEVLNIFLDKIGERPTPYKYIAIDPITRLEELVMPLAVLLYKKTVMGKNYTGNDVLTLPNGAGYKYIRDAFQLIYNKVADLTNHLILIGHIKDRAVNKRGKEVMVRDLDLAGKLSRIVSQDMSSIGILYAKGDERYLSFQKEDVQLDYDSIYQSRATHLEGKDILISSKKEDGTIETYWNSIFLN